MKTIPRTLACVLLLASAATAEAGLLGCLKPRGSSEPAASCGPAACSACRPAYVREKYTKSAYKADCKTICIPPIKFPWMKCNEFGCPQVRCVTRFKKEEIECERQVVEWRLDESAAGCCKNGGCDTCGGHGRSCSDGCTSPPPAACSPGR